MNVSNFKPDDLFSDFENVISRIKDETGVSNKKKNSKRGKLVDVITFCESEKYLGFLSSKPPMILTSVQKIILKCFYAGSEGNEDLQLTPAEKEWLINWKEKKDKQKQQLIESVLRKHENKIPIHELILVLGRRSGKTMLASIIATYEAYKCLELYNPQEYYGLAPDNPIYILNIATAAPQAKHLYNEIRSRIRNSNYFKDKLNQESSSEEYTYLMTQYDKDTNEELKKQNRHKELIKGSIIIQCGHSNSNSLMGSGIICLIFDELAYFNEGSGKSGGQKVYGDLIPATKAFRHPDGSPAARVVQISAPAGKSGIFYSNFKLSFEPEGENMMSFQFPTWECSPIIKSKKDLESEFKKNEAEALVRYGAEFSASMTSIFFPPDCIDSCIDHNKFSIDSGNPYFKYFMHVDPALTNHNYALVIVHQELYLDKETREKKRKIIVDHIKKWTPSPGKEISITEVENYIIKLCSKFNIASITFDDWNSASTIQKFRKKGLPVKRTAYRSSYKQLIFGELRDLVVEGRLHLIPDELLVGEMKSLLFRLVGNGFKVMPDSDSEYPSDDYCDCLAGAAHMTLSFNVLDLPKTTTVKSPLGMGGSLSSIFDSNLNSRYK